MAAETTVHFSADALNAGTKRLGCSEAQETE